jgi:hypothetical protein
VRLICYPTSGAPPKIVPAPLERTWMERTDQAFAYRCLPLNIANAHGWLILNNAPFTAQWDGRAAIEGVTVQPAGETKPWAFSHFGSGVLTFDVRSLFRTEPGYDLMVTGPLNQPKDGIQPLSGVVETDWAPFTFTMNWKFTRKHTPIAFERDEPFCMFFPIQRGLVESVEPEIRSMADDKMTHEAYTAWAESRRKFNLGLKVTGSEEQAMKWQKEYFRGKSTLGAAPRDHRTKVKLKPFKPLP